MSESNTTSTPRHDGLTPERQTLFLDALAACGRVSEAAAAIGVSRTAVYNLRNREDEAGAAFAAAWDRALRNAVAVLAETAFERAIGGVMEPVYYKGEQVGERVRHNDRLLMFLLRTLDPDTYGPRKPEEAAPPTPAYARPRPYNPAKQRTETPAFMSTSSTSRDDAVPDLEAMAASIEMDVEAAVATLRASEKPQRVTKRNARRLVAKQRAARR